MYCCSGSGCPDAGLLYYIQDDKTGLINTYGKEEGLQLTCLSNLGGGVQQCSLKLCVTQHFLDNSSDSDSMIMDEKIYNNLNEGGSPEFLK